MKGAMHYRTKIKKLEARNAELEQLIDHAESIFINCTVTDGTCCCGDSMENHPNPMACGHSPTDHGGYAVACWMKARRALLKGTDNDG